MDGGNCWLPGGVSNIMRATNFLLQSVYYLANWYISLHSLMNSINTMIAADPGMPVNAYIAPATKN